MKYLLVLGFCCDVYRKKPRARIFVDDKLINEFDIPHQKNNLKIAIENYFLNHYIIKQTHSALWGSKSIKSM